MEKRVSVRCAVAILLATFGSGFLSGIVFIPSYDWGAYSNLMSRAIEANRHGDGFAIFDLTQEDGAPLIVNEVALVHMVDLKLLQIQNLEQACQKYETAPSRDLIPESEYRGPKDNSWVASQQ